MELCVIKHNKKIVLVLRIASCHAIIYASKIREARMHEQQFDEFRSRQ